MDSSIPLDYFLFGFLGSNKQYIGKYNGCFYYIIRIYIHEKFKKSSLSVLFLIRMHAFSCFSYKRLYGFISTVFPILLLAFYKKNKFKNCILDTFIMFLGLTIPALILFSSHETAYMSIVKYINKQVISSLKNIQTVDTRFHIIRRFFEENITSLLFALIIVIIGISKNVSKDFLRIMIKMDIYILGIDFFRCHSNYDKFETKCFLCFNDNSLSCHRIGIINRTYYKTSIYND